MESEWMRESLIGRGVGTPDRNLPGLIDEVKAIIVKAIIAEGRT